MPNEPRTFTDAEVEAILSRAIERAGSSGKTKLSLDELVSIGEELGISRAAIEGAAAEIAPGEVASAAAASTEIAAPAEKSEQERVRQWQVRARHGWFRHFFIYLAVNAFLLFVNLMTSPGYLWFLWPLAGWGLGVALHARPALFSSTEEVQEHLVRRERQRQKRERRRLKMQRQMELHRQKTERQMELHRQKTEREMERHREKMEQWTRRKKHTRVAPMDDAKLRARIDQRVDAVLAERGVRIADAREALLDEEDDTFEPSERSARRR